MNGPDSIALLPLLVTAYATVLLSVVLAFWRSFRAAFWLSLGTLLAAMGSVAVALPYAPRQVTLLIRIDAYSLFLSALVILTGLLVVLLSRDYLAEHSRRVEAFCLLLLLAVLGMIALVCSSHFASLFVAYETLSVSLVGMIGYTLRRKPSLEAAIKYLVLSAASSAFLVFGMATVYFEFGTMEFTRLAPVLTAGAASTTAYFGLALMLVGFGYKLALVPFHSWSPDVYQGAPAPVAALIASGSKAAVLALLLRVVVSCGLSAHDVTYAMLYLLAAATMFGGNLLALRQGNLKRLLAYSSIAQLGYLLIPLAAGGESGPASIAFYLVSYTATTVAAFGVVTIVSSAAHPRDVERIEDYRGLAQSHPVLAAVMSLALFSLLGMPLTSGFFAKFYVFAAAARSGLWSLLVIGVVNSGISAFYYLRVVFAMYSRSEAEPAPLPGARAASAVSLAIASTVVILFGLYPTPLLVLSQAAALALGVR